jgi:hypothetical protein
MTNYIYLLYGAGDECYREAAYSIGTLKRKFDPATSRIIVFTDQPGKIKDWPVICESVAGELEAMRGVTQFNHRAKLCVILKCFELHPGNVIYLDSDTIIRGKITGLAGRLCSGTAIMHIFESRNPFSELTGFQARLANQIIYRYSPDSWMYNAGVIGIHSADRALVGRALELCDALLDFGNRKHTVEQFSISETLRVSGHRVLEARGTVVHYVRHKPYVREKISQMIRETGTPPWAFEREISYSYLRVYWMQKLGLYRQ